MSFWDPNWRDKNRTTRRRIICPSAPLYPFKRGGGRRGRIGEHMTLFPTWWQPHLRKFVLQLVKIHPALVVTIPRLFLPAHDLNRDFYCAQLSSRPHKKEPCTKKGNGETRPYNKAPKVNNRLKFSNIHKSRQLLLQVTNTVQYLSSTWQIFTVWCWRPVLVPRV